ncbi:UDP-N-acetylmuramate dehydrogenase [Ruficoccus amylovorans]|uniref:UDP-N-acetylenolpyruvoylglucosamine reductase n=1 Tax=Ruficoccus amylovorans TaxID=1804625 RepID=A0A842HG31_9BACT|nr:UDP-N-acetylmuramate dehydrogenase [Ruficoccus amylovorans]MBC2595372.1 UDP-N-acetylmuramate dehydrogenase [Ruficoccus amylovorans]
MMTLPENLQTTLPEEVFLLGIGGMGMAPLAVYLAQAGCRVRGWDDNLKAPIRALLEAQGIEILDTPQVGSVDSSSLVVRSSAVDPAHPLLARCGIDAACLRRGEFLARLAAGKKLVAVAGSHGKTTTTGMLIDMLRAVGFDFGYVLGGLFSDGATPPARYSATSPWLVAEVDESDGTIEGFSPAVTLVVNLDWDHADRYRTEADLRAAFARLFSRTSEHILLPENFPSEEGAAAPVLRFEAPGINFNLDNANAALQACRLISGVVPENPLAAFPGICRRQDVIHREERMRVMADYAHHPTEIRALLGMVKHQSEGPVWVVFQPHRYSRTRQFAREFAQVLAAADRAWVLPVYAASELPDAGGTEERILSEAPECLEAVSPADLNGVLDRALEKERPAALLFVGAGDIDRMAARFVRDRQQALNWREGLSTGAVLRLGEPLARKTTIGIGGPARFYAEPATEADVAYLLREAKSLGLPVLPLGRGSNLIVADAGFDGLALGFRHETWQRLELDPEGRIVAGTGVRLKQLCSFAAKNGLGGFEFLEGIPGTVGGSLRMNAGAMGGWTFDVVAEVTFIDASGALQTWPRERFHFGYRQCREIAQGLALSAVFASGQSGESESIRARMDSYAGSRKESQPREPSAGCIFKNPEGGHAGRIIDELGLKGLREGGAEVSAVHANFIVNTGGATAADVIALVRRIRETARRERGVELEPEVLLAGLKWEELL